MGTWSTSTFGCDHAYDWYDFFCESDQSVQILGSIFDTVLLEGSNEIEKGSGLSTYIQVAGEIVAFINGYPCDDFPDERYHEEGGDIDSPMPSINRGKLTSKLDHELKEKAVKALYKLLESESPTLRLSWAEPRFYEDWRLGVQDLIARIQR